MNRQLMNRQMFKMGGAAFPDLSGDGEVTQKDILIGRGVIEKQEGGMVPETPMMMEETMVAAPEPAMMMEDPMMMPQEGQATPEGLAGIFQQMQGQIDNLDEADDLEEMMNAVRGDVQPVEARRAELAEFVGPDDAQQTPDTVLALVQPVMQLATIDQGIGSLAADEMMDTPVEGPMAEGIMSTVNMAPDMPAEALMMEVGSQPPVNFNQGGAVQYFADENLQRVAGFPTVDNIQQAFDERKNLYRGILGDSAAEDQAMLDEQRRLSQAQMLFDVANTALAFATPGSRQMSPAERLAEAAQETQLLDKIGARSQSIQDLKDKQALARRSTAQSLDLAALGAAEKDIEGVRSIQAALARAKAGRASKPMELVSKDGTVRMIDGNNVDFEAINRAGSTIRPLGTPEKGFVNLYDTESGNIEMVKKTDVDRFVANNPTGNWVDTGTYSIKDDDDKFTQSQITALVTNEPFLERYAEGKADPTNRNRFHFALIDLISPKFFVDATGTTVEKPGQALIPSQVEAIEKAIELDPDSVPRELHEYVNPKYNVVEPYTEKELEEELEEFQADQRAKGQPELTTLSRATLESPKFKQSLTDASGAINPESPAWKYVPTFTMKEVQRQNVPVEIAQGLSRVGPAIERFFKEPASDILDIRVEGATRDLAIADVALRNIRLALGQFLTADLPDRDQARMLSAEYDRLEQNLAGLEPGVFTFDVTGLETLKGAINAVARSMTAITKQVPEWGSQRTDSNQGRVAKRRAALDEAELLMAEMINLRDNLEFFTQMKQNEQEKPMEKVVGGLSFRKTKTDQ